MLVAAALVVLGAATAAALFYFFRVIPPPAAKCGCGAVKLALSGKPLLSFECWCLQCRASAKWCANKGGDANINALNEYDGVHNHLYRAGQVACISGAETVAAVKGFNGVGFNPTRFYCSVCNTYLCYTPWAGAVHLNAKLCHGGSYDGPLPPTMCIDFGDMLAGIDNENIKLQSVRRELRKSGRVEAKLFEGMPIAFREAAIMTHPLRAPELQKEVPSFLQVAQGTPSNAIFDQEAPFNLRDVNKLRQSRWDILSLDALD